MDVERAFQRREQLQQRLARIERTGSAFVFGSDDFRSPKMCPEAVDGQHGVATSVGRCPYCDRFLGYPSSVRVNAQPNRDLDVVTDPVTLEPVNPFERDEPQRRPRRSRRTD